MDIFERFFVNLDQDGVVVSGGGCWVARGLIGPMPKDLRLWTKLLPTGTGKLLVLHETQNLPRLESRDREMTLRLETETQKTREISRRETKPLVRLFWSKKRVAVA
uniref:Uncharacterized protein n=1 Tax=Globodera pallida TaxID=36090 RepID=A0A183CTU0_GLOPA